MTSRDALWTSSPTFPLALLEVCFQCEPLIADWIKANLVATVILLSLLVWIPAAIHTHRKVPHKFVLTRQDNMRRTELSAQHKEVLQKRRNSFAVRESPTVVRSRVAPAPAGVSPRAAAGLVENPVAERPRRGQGPLRESAV
jgi:hypothetical protein